METSLVGIALSKPAYTVSFQRVNAGELASMSAAGRQQFAAVRRNKITAPLTINSGQQRLSFGFRMAPVAAPFAITLHARQKSSRFPWYKSKVARICSG